MQGAGCKPCTVRGLLKECEITEESDEQEVIGLKKRSDLTRLLDIAGGHKYLIYASWVLSAISALVALIPYCYIWAIMDEVLAVAPHFEQAKNLVHNGWMAVIFAVAAVLIYIAGLMCSHMGAFRIATNIRIRAMEHIVSLPLGFAEDFGSGKLRKIVDESSAATETYLAHQLPDKAGAVATPCGLLIMLLVFDWRLGLLSLVPVFLAFLIMMAMTGARMEEKMKEYQDALDDMSNEAVEYVRGIPVVKTFGQTIFSFKKFKGAIDRYHEWVVAYTKELRMPMVFYTAIINGVFVFLIVGGLVLTKGGVTDEFMLDLIFYIIVTPVISLTLTRIMFHSENAMVVNDALQRIDSIMDMKPLKEPVRPKKPQGASVELQDVSFSYDGENDVLKNISISVPEGKTVALVGPSGGGKTTLAGMIPRFFDPRRGVVKIGGVDVKDIPKEELMETVSFVFQNSCLIKASILDNVKMGRPEATRDEVMQALEDAGCMDIIEKLPDGVDTVIGTKGVYLSGGEQQRVAIARVMLKNTPVVILDEATAFADPDNEARVQEAFSRLSKEKTVVMIAHRLSTVMDVDMVYVLEDGRITESGSHSALLEQDGTFRRMWENYRTAAQWRVTKEVQA